ncbi:filamentous hemagglutinin N-terminal domain-containing protein, partial [Thalassospira sp. MCCC 1A01428]|uniref:filamentous hemagglutinin N-terminal domain-containing protein n=1 Tax=Thalassospira sp. MCCC 1A01428 TaxID=1470575 RepID=UPI000A1E0131
MLAVVRENKHKVIKRAFAYALTTTTFLAPVMASATPQIVTDGQTATNLNVHGSVTDVTTSTIQGNSALNSFSKFDVYQGNTVNLFVPGQADHLINMVNGPRSHIDGILNSIKNGQIGGQVYLLNPNGVAIGAQGQLNVGSLTIMAPSEEFSGAFFDAPGHANEGALQQLLAGKVPLSENGLITIDGSVRATRKAALIANGVQVAGNVVVGAQALNQIAFSDVVNVEGLDAGQEAVVDESGYIEIKGGLSGVDISGVLAANGADGQNAGTIDVRATGDISVRAGADISAHGVGADSSGGNITIFADQNASFETGAHIDISGGDVSGDGGFAEFSALKSVALNGGTFAGGAVNGTAGTVLIDPENLTISSDLARNDGTNYVFEADDTITLADDVTVSTKTVTSKSGNITLTARNIFLGDRSTLDAGDGGENHGAGDITIKAAGSTSHSISMTGASLTGANVSITATAIANDGDLVLNPLSDVSATVTLTNTVINASGNVTVLAKAEQGLPTLTGQVFDARSATASLTMTNGSITAGGNISLASSSKITSEVIGALLVSPINASVAVTDSTASTLLTGSATLAAGGDVDVTSTAITDSTAVAKSVAAAVGVTTAVSVIDNSATTRMMGAAKITQANAVTVRATGKTQVDTIADAATVENGGSGASIGVAISDVSATAIAEIGEGATVSGASSLTVNAQNVTTQNTASRAGVADGAGTASGLFGDALDKTGLGDTEKGELSALFDGVLGQITDKLSEKPKEGEEGSGGAQVAGALSYVSSNFDTQALISSNADKTLSLTGALAVNAEAIARTNTLASGITAGGKAGGGAGVAIQTVDNKLLASIAADNTKTLTVNAKGVAVNATTKSIDTDITDEDGNSFGVQAFAGQEAEDVGFAGALGLLIVNSNSSLAEIGDNVAVDGKAGSIEIVATGGADAGVVADGAPDDETVIGALFEAYETYTETEEDEDASPSVGIGAAIAINISNSTVDAALRGGATLTNASGLTVSAVSNGSVKTTANSAGAGGVALVPVLALSVANDHVTAGIETSDAALSLAGAVSVKAEQNLAVLSVGKAASGDADDASKVAIGLTVGISTVNADATAMLDRDLTTTGDLTISAKSARDIRTGAAAGTNTDPGDTGTEDEDSSDSAKSDVLGTIKQAAAFGNLYSADKDKVDGDKTASKANVSADKGDDADEGGKISAAAALGLTVADTSTSAGIAASRTVSGANIKVTAADNTDSQAAADGSAAEADNNIGAAVALNIANVSNSATIGSSTKVTGTGLTLSALTNSFTVLDEDGNAVKDEDDNDVVDDANKYVTSAVAGAGVGNLSLAGAVAISLIDQTTTTDIGANADITVGASGAAINAASSRIIETMSSGAVGEKTPTLDEFKDRYTTLGGMTARINGKLTSLGEKIEAGKSDSDSGSGNDSTGDSGGGSGKLGIGASFAITVDNTVTRARISDGAKVTTTDTGDVVVSATSAVEQTTHAEAASAPSTDLLNLEEKSDTSAYSLDAAVAIAVNNETTEGRIGTDQDTLTSDGKVNVTANSDSKILVQADGEAAGDKAAAGASLALGITNSTTSASLARSVAAQGAITVSSTALSKDTTLALATARGTLLESYKNKFVGATDELLLAGDFGNEDGGDKKPRSAQALTDQKTSGNNKTSSVDETGKTDSSKSGKSISIAAAVGVGVNSRKSSASVDDSTSTGAYSLSSGGKIDVTAKNDANAQTQGVGAAVLTDTAIAVGVAVTATDHETTAKLGDYTKITASTGVNVTAQATQNQSADFANKLMAEAVAGAGAKKTGVAGALSVINTDNDTGASFGKNVDVTSTGAVNITSTEKNHIVARAIAATISAGAEAKAGVGATFALINAGNTNKALVDEGSKILTTGDLTVSAKNLRQSESSFGFDGDYSLLNPTSVFQTSNYYTEALAGAASTGNTALAGSFSVTVTQNETTASIADTATASAKDITLEAENRQNARTLGGAISASKKTGVGVTLNAMVLADTVSAQLGKTGSASGASLTASGDVAITAKAEQDLGSILVAGSVGGSGTAVSGSVGINVIETEANALVSSHSAISSKGGVDVAATSKTGITSFVGGLAVSGQTGVGAGIATNLILAKTRAGIGDNAEIDAANTIAVNADASEDISAATVSAAVSSGGTTVAVSLGANTVKSDTTASVGNDAKLNSGNTAGSRSISVTAKDKTDIGNIIGSGAFGTGTGVGGVLASNAIAKNTKAVLNGTATADTNVNVTATSEQNITALSLGVAVVGGTAITGSGALALIDNTTTAVIGELAENDAVSVSRATVISDGNVAIHASDETDALILTGSGAGGGGNAGGASLGVSTFIGETTAYIGRNANVTARGNATGLDVMTGGATLSSALFNGLSTLDTDTAGSKLQTTSDDALALKSSSIDELKDGAFKKTLTTEKRKGLSVTAYSDQDIANISATGAAGGGTAVAGAVAVGVVSDTTKAYIDNGAKINQAAGAAGTAQTVTVQAQGDTLSIDVAGGVAIGGSNGIGGSIDSLTLSKTTSAYIGQNAVVGASDDVVVAADQATHAISVAANVAVAGNAGVGASLSVLVASNVTTAYIDGFVTTDGDITLDADSDTTFVQVAGQISAGGSAGVGGALGVSVQDNTTTAYIDTHGQTNVKGKTTVSASGKEQEYAAVVAGAGGGSAGVAGSVRVGVHTSTTQAYVAGKVNQNADYSLSGQNVHIDADSFVRVVSVTGGLGGGGVAGIGAAADVIVLRNNSNAFVSGGSVVSAHDDISISATSEKQLLQLGVAGAAGGQVGVAGALTVAFVGGIIDDDAKSHLSSSDEDNSGDTWSAADEATNKNLIGNALGDREEATTANNAAGAQRSKNQITDDFNATAEASRNDTKAFVGQGATLIAGQDVSITSADTSKVIAGTLAVAGSGGVSVGGGITITTVDSSAQSYIGNLASVDATRAISIKAASHDSVINAAAAGGGALYTAINGSVAITTLLSDATAYIGDNAKVNQDDDVTDGSSQDVVIDAKSDSNVVTVSGAAGGAIVGIGAAANVTTIAKQTNAWIGKNAKVDAARNITLDATSDDNLVAVTVSVQGGLVGAGGTAAINTIVSDTAARVLEGAAINATGSMRVQALNDAELDDISTSVAVGGAALGGVVSVNTVSATTEATIADGAKLNILGNGSGINIAAAGGSRSDSTETALAKTTQTNDDDSTLTVSAIDVDRSTLTRNSETITGLAVVARSDQDVTALPISAGASAAGALSGVATVNVIAGSTLAQIGTSAVINAVNAGASDNQDVLVAAYDSTDLSTVPVTVAVTGTGPAVSAAAATNVIAKTLSAKMGGTVSAKDDITVLAVSDQDLDSVSANGAVSALAGHNVSLGVDVVDNTVLAELSDSAIVTSGDDLGIRATENTDFSQTIGSASVGGVTAAGGAIGVAVASSDVTARIGKNAVTNADGTTSVAANSAQTMTQHTVAGGASAGLALQGAISVRTATVKTLAEIGDGAKINQTSVTADDDQAVLVSANNSLTVGGVTGAGAVGGVAGVGFGMDIAVARNSTAARIGQNTLVSATDDVSVTAHAQKDISATGIAGAGGLGAGVAGSVAIAILGGDADSRGTDQLTSDNGSITDQVNSDAGTDRSADLTSSDAGKLAHSQAGDANSDRTTAKSKTRNVMGALDSSNGTFDDGVSAVIDQNATVKAGGNINVTAKDESRVRAFAGGAAVGAVGVGGWVAVASMGTTAQALIGQNADLDAGDTITISSDLLDKTDRSKVEAYGASAGVVGVAATIAVLDRSTTTQSLVGSGANIFADNAVSITAQNSSGGQSRAIAGAAGFAAAGISVAVTSSDDDVKSEVGANARIGKKGDPAGSITVSATNGGSFDAYSVGASLGLVGSGAGADATVDLDGDTTAKIGTGATLYSDGDVLVAASDEPHAKAQAIGASLSAGYSLGVSISQALVDRNVAALVDDNASVTGDTITLDAKLLKGAANNADATATAGSGGLLVGAAGSSAVTTLDGDVSASTGNNVKLLGIERTQTDENNVTTAVADHGISLNTRNESAAEARAIGVTAGAIAVGAHSAVVDVTTTSNALLGAGTNAITMADLSITAVGAEHAYGDTISGAGGVGVVQAGLTKVDLDSMVKAGTRDNSALTTLSADGTTTISATSSGKYDGKIDTTGAALAQAAAGALVVNGTSDVWAGFGAKTGLRTHQLSLLALNELSKDLVSDANFKTSQGGGFNMAVGVSSGTMNASTNISVGANSNVYVFGTSQNQGVASVQAKTNVTVDDESSFDSGGLISAPIASTIQTANLSSNVTMGDNASLQTQAGDLSVAARSDAKMSARARSVTYGFAGAAGGVSKASVTANDAVTVGSNTNLVGVGDVEIYAGADATGLGIIEAKADTRLFNKTAISIPTPPTADASAIHNSKVTIGSGSLVASAKDLRVQATEGHLFANGVGRATDLAKKALEAIGDVFGADTEGSLEVVGGTSKNEGVGGIKVDGELRTGIRNKRYITFGTSFSSYVADSDGNMVRYYPSYDTDNDQWVLATEDPDNPGVPKIIKVFTPEEISEGMGFSILADQNLGQSLQTEVARLENVLLRYGSSTDANSVQIKSDIESRLTILRAAIASRKSDEYVDVIQVDPTEAATGNVELYSDYVVGSGKINSPGDAEIKIINNSPMPIRIAEMTIPDELGGQILFNGQSVLTATDINARNSNADGTATMEMVSSVSSDAPKIIIENNFDPDSGVYNLGNKLNIAAPDVILAGQINNINGLIKVTSDQGSIYSVASMRGETVEISTGGDFVFDSPETLLNIGAHPDAGFGSLVNQYENGSATSGSANNVSQAADDSSSTIAANNVFINADTININGVIQSGIADKEITINQSDVDAAYAAGNSSGARYVEVKNVGISMGSGRVGVGGIKAELDRVTGEIRILDAKVEGGTVLLSGRLVSTGNGKINVIDGYGQITINNNSTNTVLLDDVDTGGIEGQITLIDKSKDNGTGRALITRYERIGDSLKVYSNAGTDSAQATKLQSSNNGRTSTYAMQDDMRYYWMAGKSTTTQTTKAYSKQQKSLFGFIPISEREFSDSNLVSGYPQSHDLSQADLPEGDYVAQHGGLADYTFNSADEETSNKQIYQGDSERSWGSDCAWFVCFSRTYEFKRTTITETGTNTYYYHSVAADKPIDIAFIGYDSGAVDVTSKGSIALGGSLQNVGGATTLTSTAGDIYSNGGAVQSGNLVLSAANGSVGRADNYLNLVQKSGDLVSVTSGKNIYLDAPGGSLVLSNLTAGSGSIGLRADFDIITSGSGVIKGRDVELIARNGKIGTSDGVLKVDTDAANGGKLTAKAARGDINVEEVSGDLIVNRIETVGDVSIKVSDGNLIDGNIDETEDTDTTDQLLALFDSLDLTGADADAKKDAQVKAYENEQETLYDDYFTLRNLHKDGDGNYVADAVDADYTYVVSDQERSSLTDAGLDSDAIQSYADRQTERYRTAYDKFGDVTYNADYSYTATSDEIAAVTDGYKWTQKELTNLLPSFAFKETTDTTTVVETANVSARNVTIDVKGNMGSHNGDIVLDLTKSNDLTDEVKVAMAAAERDDIIRDDTNHTLTIVQREDFDIDATGTTTIKAGGDLFLGSENDLNVFNASGQEIRVKIGGSITNGRDGDGANFEGGRMIFEAGDGHIGTASAPIMINQTDGSLLTARAADDIYMHEISGNIYVDGLFSSHNVNLSADNGSILDGANDAIADIVAQSITLSASKSIGSTATGGALDVGINSADGSLILTTADGGAYLSGPGRFLALGAVDVNGVLNLNADNGITLRSSVNSHGNAQTYQSASDIVMLAASSISSGGGAVSMTATTTDITQADGSKINAGSGTISLTAAGDITLASLVTSNASSSAISVDAGGQIIDGGDTDDDITSSNDNGIVSLTADEGIGRANAIDTNVTRLSLANSDSGKINIAEKDSLVLQTVAITSATDTTVITRGDLTLASSGMLETNGLTFLTAQNNGSLAIDGVWTSSAGAATLVADKNITFGALGSIAMTGNGDLSLTAAKAGENGGYIRQTDGASINVGTGKATLVADGDIGLANLVSNNATLDAIVLTTAHGGITDSGDSNIDLVANAVGAGVTINSATGIGADNAIETNLASVTATNTTSGAVALNETDTLNVTKITQQAANGAVTVTGGTGLVIHEITAPGAVSLNTTAGDIVDKFTNSITAASLNLDAGGNVNLVTTVSTLDNVIIRDGKLTLENTQNLNINRVSQQTTDANKSGIDINASGSISVANAKGGISANVGNITLKANALESVITVSDAIATTNGDIELQAAKLIDLNDALADVTSQNAGMVSLSVLDGSISQTDGSTIDGGTGKVLLVVSGSLTLDQVKTTGADIVITAKNGSVTAKDFITTSAAKIDITAAQNVTFDNGEADVTSTGSGAVTVIATEGSIEQKDGSTIDGGSGKVTLTAGDSLTLDQVKTDSADIAITAQTGLVTAKDFITTSAAKIDITAAQNVIFDNGEADVTSTGSGAVTVIATAGSIEQKDGSTIDGGVANVTLTAGQNLVLDQIRTSNADITLEAQGDTLDAYDFIQTENGKIAIKAAKKVTLHNSNTNIVSSGSGDVEITSLGDSLMQYDGTIDGGTGNVTLLANQALVLNEVKTGNAGISLTAQTNAIALNNAVSTDGGNIIIKAATAVNLFNANSDVTSANGGTVSITATSGNILQNDGSRIDGGTGAVTLFAGGNVTLDQVQTSDAAIEITADGGYLEANDFITTSAADITLVAENDVHLNSAQADITASGSGAISINSRTGSLTQTDGSTIDGGSGKVTLAADQDVTLDQVQTTNAAIVITSRSASIVARDYITTDTANIDISAAQSVTLFNDEADVTSTGSGDVTITATAGDLYQEDESTIDGGTGKVTLTAGKKVTLDRVQTTTSAIQITAQGGDVVANDFIKTSDASIEITGDNDVSFTNGLSDVTSTGNGAVTVIATKGSITQADGSTIDGGSDKVTLTAGDSQTLDQVKTTGADIAITAQNGSVTAKDFITTSNANIGIMAAQNVTLFNGEADVTSTGSGDVTITATAGDLYQEDESTIDGGTGKVTLTAGNKVTLDQVQTTTSAIAITAQGGDVVANDFIKTSDATIDITGDNDVSFSNGLSDVTSTDTGDVTVIATKGSITQADGSTIDGGSDKVTLTAGDSQTLDQVKTSGADIAITAQNGSVTAKDFIMTSNANIGIMAAQNVTLFNGEADVTSTGSGDVTITATAGDLYQEDESTIDGGTGKVTLTAGNKVTLDQVQTTTSAIAITAQGGDVVANDFIKTSDATIDITGDNDVSFSNGLSDVTSTDTGDVTVIATKGSITQADGSTIDGGSDKVTLTAGDSQTLDQVKTSGADIAITAQNGSVTAKDFIMTSNANIGITAAQNVTLFNGEADVTSTGSGDVSITATAGDLYQEDESTIDGGTGKVTLTAGKKITLDQVQTTTSAIAITAQGGDVVANDFIKTSDATIEITGDNDVSFSNGLSDVISSGTGAITIIA